MPYNTRRKSLSLPSLGIQLPNASRAHRSPPAARLASSTDLTQPPPKKVKRSHSGSISPSTLPDVQEQTPIIDQASDQRPKSRRDAYEHTPPPSPGASGVLKIDTEGINDDLVVAVIEQLEKTGNRPHLIKELAAVLATSSDAVANSANAAALLSSRLSAYLKRPWTALAPCPLAKELIPIHPRKVFYYLTNSPHQPLPDNSDDILGPSNITKQVTPSVSCPSVDHDEMDRGRMSPSPEIDLSPPDFDEDDEDVNDSPGGPPTPSGSFSSRSSLGRDGSEHRLSHNHRAVSPPLEGDEREFTQTASSVRERGMSLEDTKESTETDDQDQGLQEPAIEETAEVLHSRDAAKLFGPTSKHDALLSTNHLAGSSPVVKTRELHIDIKPDHGDAYMISPDGMELKGTSDVEMMMAASWEMRSPENIELEELDDLLGCF